MLLEKIELNCFHFFDFFYAASCVIIWQLDELTLTKDTTRLENLLPDLADSNYIGPRIKKGRIFVILVSPYEAEHQPLAYIDLSYTIEKHQD